ncbi:MAG: very short patch repair endonuclease [Candidatus Nanoarchaeia archaeon]|nr:very short patch repair endonuclease [Candidatus Nanoarchaeia archaeon]
MDVLTKSQRSKCMSSIKSKNSNIERILTKALKKKGLQFKKNYSKIIGKPDIAFPKEKIAVFCDSEFWHGYKWAKKKKEIKSNKRFWHAKIERNIKRDKQVNRKLKNQGWLVIRFWGQKIGKNSGECVKMIDTAVKKRKNLHNI